jgi:hypothetical protein
MFQSVNGMKLLDNRYQLLKALGQAGSCVSYLAQDMHSNSNVVVRQYQLDVVQTDSAVWRKKLDELRRLQHPMASAVIDFFTAKVAGSMRAHLILSFVGGRSLATALRTRKIPRDEASLLVARVLGTLQEIHSQGFIHGNLKPSGIILSDSGPCITDFGVTGELVSIACGYPFSIGAMGYQAPEQIHGSSLPVSDVYSLSAVALEVLTGQSVLTMMRLDGFGLDWRPAAVDLPQNVKDWLEKGLALDARDRFQSAGTALVAWCQLGLHSVTGKSGLDSKLDRLSADMAAERKHTRAKEREAQAAALALEAAVAGEIRNRQTQVARAWSKVMDRVLLGLPAENGAAFLIEEFGGSEFGIVRIGARSENVELLELEVARAIVKGQIDASTREVYLESLQDRPSLLVLRQRLQQLKQAARLARLVVKQQQRIAEVNRRIGEHSGDGIWKRKFEGGDAALDGLHERLGKEEQILSNGIADRSRLLKEIAPKLLAFEDHSVVFRSLQAKVIKIKGEYDLRLSKWREVCNLDVLEDESEVITQRIRRPKKEANPKKAFPPGHDYPEKLVSLLREFEQMQPTLEKNFPLYERAIHRISLQIRNKVLPYLSRPRRPQELYNWATDVGNHNGLPAVLNDLVQLLSYMRQENREEVSSDSVRLQHMANCTWLDRLVYEEISNACSGYGWFQILDVRPFTKPPSDTSRARFMSYDSGVESDDPDSRGMIYLIEQIGIMDMMGDVIQDCKASVYRT